MSLKSIGLPHPIPLNTARFKLAPKQSWIDDTKAATCNWLIQFCSQAPHLVTDRSHWLGYGTFATTF